MTKPGRIPCEGIGCRRTASEEKFGKGTRIICSKCWRLAPRATRIESAKIEREIKVLDEKLTARHEAGTLRAGDPMIAEFEVLEARGKVLWKEIVDAIQQARTGI